MTLHLSDGTGKYSTMTQTREDSYYLRYNMGSTTGEAFSNRITCSKGSDDVIDLDIELPNVVFRDSNEMKMNVIFQYPSVRTSTSGKKTNVVKTRTTAVNFTFTKAKLDLTVTKPNNPLTDDEKDKEKDKTFPAPSVSTIRTEHWSTSRAEATTNRIQKNRKQRTERTNRTSKIQTTRTAKTITTITTETIITETTITETIITMEPAGITRIITTATTAIPTSRIPRKMPCLKHRICCCRSFPPAAMTRWQPAANSR